MTMKTRMGSDKMYWVLLFDGKKVCAHGYSDKGGALGAYHGARTMGGNFNRIGLAKGTHSREELGSLLVGYELVTAKGHV